MLRIAFYKGFLNAHPYSSIGKYCRSNFSFNPYQYKNLKLFLLLVFIIQSTTSYSQKFNYTSADFLLGKVVSNYPSFPEINNPALFIRARVGKSLTGYKPWHRYYNHPDFGANVVYGSLGNKEVMGTVFGITPEMTLKQKLSAKFYLSEGIGLGISYFNKKYDEKTNPTNIVIGSHLTAFGSLSFNLNYQLSDDFTLVLSVNALHCSNSHVALPNLGANMPALGIGMRYQLNKPEKIVEENAKPAFDKKIHFNLKAGLGINEQGSSTIAVNGPKYPIYVASVFVTKKVSYVNKLQFGFEGYYNTGVYDFITSQNLYGTDQKQKSTAAFVFAGHEFLFGHFSFATILGGYVYNPFYRSQYILYYEDDYKTKIKTTVVLKIGMQFYFWNAHTHDKNQLYIGTYVKTNFGQADFLENCIGFQF